MNDRLLTGTRRESSVWKTGNSGFRKRKKYGLVIAGWKDNSLPRKYSSFADLSD
ncbi:MULTISPECIES: hypothetical protein [Bacteroides]|uniref:hypothetical protein n=1 Tax=Bacteroides TaxID=816 RepID=UPI001314A7BC|nr:MULTISPECIES: hypothetical protein [Bacteroides]